VGLFGLRIADRGLRKPVQPFGSAIADVWVVRRNAGDQTADPGARRAARADRGAYWLILAVAVVVPMLALLMFPRRARPWVLLALASSARCSSSPTSSTTGSLATCCRRLRCSPRIKPATSGAPSQPLHTWPVVLIADWPFALWLVAKMSRQPVPAVRGRIWTAMAAAIAGLAASALAVSVPRVLIYTPLDQMFRARSVVEQLGPFGYHAYDTWNYVRGTWLRRPRPPRRSTRRWPGCASGRRCARAATTSPPRAEQT